MKKVLSLITALVLIFTFAACSRDNAQENEESSKQGVSSSSNEAASNEDNSNDTSDAGSTDGKKPTDGKVQNGTTKADTTKKGETTSKGSKPATEPTTVKRKIKLNVTYPAHNNVDTTVNIEYKKPKDKKFKSLFEKKVKNSKGKEETIIDKPEITLDNIQKVSYTIDEEIAGDVVLKFTVDGVKLFEDEFTISGRDSEISIELIASTEIMDGGWD